MDPKLPLEEARTSNFEIKQEPDDTEFEMKDLHHSIDIKEESHFLEPEQIKCECYLCGIGFCDKSEMIKHLETECLEKPFSCEICAFRCLTKIQLNRHMKTHIDNIVVKHSHYTNRERELLASLIKDHPLLESKKTDNSTINKKQQEWEKLTAEYNRKPEVNTTRSSSQLKILWKNLKQRKRKQTSFERHEAFLTRGGLPSKISNDNTFDSTAAFERRFIHTSAEMHGNATTLTPANGIHNLRPSASNDVTYKLPSNSPTIAVDDSPISFTDEQGSTSPKTITTPLKRKAYEEGNLHMKRIKTMIEADAELHKIRLEIANLEKLKAISDLNKSRYDEEISKITLERLKNKLV